MGCDGLGDVAQGLFVRVDTDNGAVVAYPEPQSSGLVLVQYGRYRNESLL